MSTTIDLGKLRFLFRGDYVVTDTYSYNDVVKNGGNSYIYINGTATAGNPCTDTAYWSPLVDGMAASGDWSSSTPYGLNALVKHGGAYYRAIAASTNVEPPNAVSWEPFVEGYNHRNAWVTATAYKVDDSVIYAGQSYRCLVNHTSGGSFLSDFTGNNWERYAGGVNDRGEYAVDTDYYIGDLAFTGTIPNRDIYMCTADHTSSTDTAQDPAVAPESANWTIWINGQLQGSAAINAYAYFSGLSG